MFDGTRHALTRSKDIVLKFVAVKVKYASITLKNTLFAKINCNLDVTFTMQSHFPNKWVYIMKEDNSKHFMLQMLIS